MEEGDLGLASALVKVWNPLENGQCPVSNPLPLSVPLSLSLSLSLSISLSLSLSLYLPPTSLLLPPSFCESHHTVAANLQMVGCSSFSPHAQPPESRGPKTAQPPHNLAPVS